MKNFSLWKYRQIKSKQDDFDIMIFRKTVSELNSANCE